MSVVAEEIHILTVGSVNLAIEVNEHSQLLAYVVGRYLENEQPTL
jgi:hypothetical protein